MMQFSYDPEVDALRLRVSDMRFADSDEVAPGVIVDFDENGQVIAIEVLDVRARTEPVKVNLPNRTSYLPNYAEAAGSVMGVATAIPGVQTGGHAIDGFSVHEAHHHGSVGHTASDVSGMVERVAGVVTGERVDEKSYPIG